MEEKEIFEAETVGEGTEKVGNTETENCET